MRPRIYQLDPHSDDGPPSLAGSRLRFTLSGLLWFVSGIGVLLALLLWRWQETRKLYLGETRAITTTTSYRRDWFGRTLRHGRQFTLDDEGKLLFEWHYHDDRLLLERRFHPPGTLISEKAYPLSTASR